MRWLLFVLLIVLSSCNRDKGTGPDPGLPGSGTILYFADCNPSSDSGLGTLIADGSFVCQSDIVLYGSEIVWRSNLFHDLSGAITEGYHLVFSREALQAQDSSYVTVHYAGIGTDITRYYTLPPGELISVREESQTSTVNMPADSAAGVTIGITGYSVRLNADPGAGSYLVIGVERNMLCEFTIFQGANGGEGDPNGVVNFSYLHAPSDVTSHLFLDYTGGAALSNQVFTFGPRYGVAYVAAESGVCRDTAFFYAPAPSQGFRVDTLTWQSRALSDGQNVWPYSYDYALDTLGACQRVRVYFPSGLLMFDRFIASCSDLVEVTYDHMNRLIWLIQRSESLLDTAWGYATTGALDTTVIAESIPRGDLVRGRWISSSVEHYVRHLYATPFTGGTAAFVADVPEVLTQDSYGFVGIAPLGATSFGEWTVNIFDTLGNWIARYPILDRDNSSAIFAGLVSADSVIVYSVYLNNGAEIRALKP